MQMGVGGVKFSGKKRYEGVRFNVISVTRGWVGVQFPGKKRYVTLEWPLESQVFTPNNVPGPGSEPRPSALQADVLTTALPHLVGKQ